jgi:hypothetical protein
MLFMSVEYIIHVISTGCIPAEELKFVMKHLPGKVPFP